MFEGPPHLTAFRDGGGVETIGRGHTAGVQAGQTITHEQSDIFFAEDEAALLELVADKPVLAAGAYVSFGYNCGHGALHAVLTGIDTIGNPKHTTDRHGVVEPGLVSRRALETALITLSEIQP